MNQRVLNIRPLHQAEELSAALRRQALLPLTVPMLELVGVSNAEFGAVRERLAAATTGSCLIFTSANGVRFFRAGLEDDAELAAKAATLRTAVIGEGTAAAARSAGLNLSFVARVSNSEGMAAEFESYARQEKLEISEALLLRAQAASRILPELISRSGIVTAALPVYDSRCPQYSAEERLDLALRFTRSHPERIDFIAATSSQALRNLVQLLESSEAALESGWHRTFARIPVGAIGPKTGDTARALGLNLALVASQAASDVLAAEIRNFFAAAGV